MALTIRELLTKEEFKAIRVVAGQNGLDNVVSSIQIADYEFAEGFEYDKEKTFLKEGIVISSLLFSYGREEKIMDAVRDFIGAHSSGLLVKTALIKRLPEEVIRYADEKGFPILEFDSLYFEEIIYDLMDLVYRGDNLLMSRDTLEKFIGGKASRGLIEKTCKNSPLQFKLFSMGVYVVSLEGRSELRSARINKVFSRDGYLRQKAFSTDYEEGVFIIITAADRSEPAFHKVIKYIMERLFSDKSEYVYYLSKVHPSFEELDKCFRESWYSCIASEASGQYFKKYSDIGTFRFLIPLKESPSVSAFSADFMERLSDHAELMETLTHFVNCKGSFIAAAIDLNCHENTIRFRIKKIQELLGLDNISVFEFYENASIAIKIAQLNEYDAKHYKAVTEKTED